MPEIETIIVETIDPEGPFGAKEVGQGPLLPVPPAVSIAVHDAVGVWIDQVPVTPDKVLKALDRKERGEEPRFGPAAVPDAPFREPTLVEPPDDAPTLERSHAAAPGAVPHTPIEPGRA